MITLKRMMLTASSVLLCSSLSAQTIDVQFVTDSGDVIIQNDGTFETNNTYIEVENP